MLVHGSNGYKEQSFALSRRAELETDRALTPDKLSGKTAEPEDELCCLDSRIFKRQIKPVILHSLPHISAS